MATKITNALPAVNFALEDGKIPCIVGEAGIGKTEILQTIAYQNNWGFVAINATNLKEGELALPMLHDNNGSPEVIYAPHSDLLRANKLAKHYERVIFVIDELNRCRINTFTELMQVIQQGRIHNFQFDENVYIACAMNPSSDMPGFEHTDYAVTTMDGAMIDRGCFFYIKPDLNSWLEYANDYKKTYTPILNDDGEEVGRKMTVHNETNIHEDISQFIANNSDFLHMPNATEFNKPTPRSWKKVSDLYKAYLAQGVERKVFELSAKGLIGQTAVTTLMSFLRENSEPLLQPEEVFEQGYTSVPKDLIKKFQFERPARLTNMIRRFLNYLIDEENEKALDNNTILFEEVIMSIDAKDTLSGWISRIADDEKYKPVFTNLLKNRDFINAYIELTNNA